MGKFRGEIVSSLAIISLFVLSVVSIGSISYLQDHKQGYKSSAKEAEEFNPPTATKKPTTAKPPTIRPTTTNSGGSNTSSLPSCKYGSYVNQGSCNNNCVVNCRNCRINTSSKWECPSSNPTEAAKSGIPSCGNKYTYNDPIYCETDTKCTSSCSSCNIDNGSGGLYTKWFCAKAGEAAGPTYNPNKLTPTVTPRPTIAPSATITPNSICMKESDCPTGYTCSGYDPTSRKFYCLKAGTPTQISQITITPSATSTPIKITSIATATPNQPAKSCGMGNYQNSFGEWIKEKKFPCTKLIECTAPGSGFSKVTEGGSDCCYQKDINSKSIPNYLCYPNSNFFVYPSAAVQPVLTGVVVTTSGEQIDCNVVTCIEE